MMSLGPSFGISNSQLLPDLWQVTTSIRPPTTAAPTAQLNAKLAYGFPTTGGLLTFWSCAVIFEASTDPRGQDDPHLTGSSPLCHDLAFEKPRSDGGSGKATGV